MCYSSIQTNYKMMQSDSVYHKTSSWLNRFSPILNKHAVMVEERHIYLFWGNFKLLHKQKRKKSSGRRGQKGFQEEKQFSESSLQNERCIDPSSHPSSLSEMENPSQWHPSPFSGETQAIPSHMGYINQWGTPIRCPNHVNGLLLIRRSSDSTLNTSLSPLAEARFGHLHPRSRYFAHEYTWESENWRTGQLRTLLCALAVSSHNRPEHQLVEKKNRSSSTGPDYCKPPFSNDHKTTRKFAGWEGSDLLGTFKENSFETSDETLSLFKIHKESFLILLCV